MSKKDFRKRKCHGCGKIFQVPHWRIRQGKGIFCSIECRYKYRRYKESGVKSSFGYVMVICRDHPKSNRGYVKVHRLVAEKMLGRYLRFDEVVHHKDGNKENNSTDNLVVMSASDHVKLHRRMEKV